MGDTFRGKFLLLSEILSEQYRNDKEKEKEKAIYERMSRAE
jgi:hypothetical protein